jgi:selT/selW/selH-like putative selenoprotein
VKLVEGENGVFDVLFNSELVFSRLQEGRFPADEEILESLKIMLQSNN